MSVYIRYPSITSDVVINLSSVPGVNVTEALNNLLQAYSGITLQVAYENDSGAFPEITCELGFPFGIVGQTDLASEAVDVVTLVIHPHQDHTTTDADIVQVKAPASSTVWASVTPYGGVKITSPFNTDVGINPWNNARFIIDGPTASSNAILMWAGVSATPTELFKLDGKGSLTVPSIVTTGITLSGDLSFSAGHAIVADTVTGLKIGGSTLQKLGFWNHTPIVQPANTVAIDTLLVNTGLRASGGVALFDTDVKVGVVGKGLYIKQGINATSGTGTLSGGTLVVSTNKITANSSIVLSGQGGGVLANIGAIYEDKPSRVAGTSFTIKSLNALDSSGFIWIIIEPA